MKRKLAKKEGMSIFSVNIDQFIIEELLVVCSGEESLI